MNLNDLRIIHRIATAIMDRSAAIAAVCQWHQMIYIFAVVSLSAFLEANLLISRSWLLGVRRKLDDFPQPLADFLWL